MGDGEGENAIMATINRVEGFHGTEHRGATGDDVIYEQNVFLAQVVGVVNAKNLGQLTAVSKVFLALMGVVVRAIEVLGINRDAGYVTNAHSYPFGLIITSLSQTLEMERERYDVVYSLKERTSCPCLSCHSSHFPTNLRLAAEFHQLDGISDRVVRRIKTIRGSSRKLMHVCKQAFHSIIPMPTLFRKR